jgi:hypothetical protein
MRPKRLYHFLLCDRYVRSPNDARDHEKQKNCECSQASHSAPIFTSSNFDAGRKQSRAGFM